jgi:hypothetical protein
MKKKNRNLKKIMKDPSILVIAGVLLNLSVGKYKYILLDI